MDTLHGNDKQPMKCVQSVSLADVEASTNRRDTMLRLCKYLHFICGNVALTTAAAKINHGHQI